MADTNFYFNQNTSASKLVFCDNENIYEKGNFGNNEHIGYLKEPVDILLSQIISERENYKNQLIEAGLIEKELTEDEKISLQNKKIDELASSIENQAKENKELKELINILIEDKKIEDKKSEG